MTRTTILAAAAALLAAMPLGAQTPAPQPAVPDTAVPPAPAPVTTAEPAPTDMPGTAPAEGDTIERVAYACERGMMLDVVYVNTASGSSFAVVSQKDELIPMQVAVSGSGARYVPVNVNQTYELLTKGDAATLYEDSDTVLAGDCTAKR